MRSVFAIFVLLLAACGTEAPRVSVSISGDAQELDLLQRITLIVREYGANTFGAREDINPRSEPMRFDAKVIPGRPFYVWIQGWTSCPASATSCVSIEDSTSGSCVCVEDREETLAIEACSTCFRAEEGDTVLPLRFRKVTEGLCPPSEDTCPTQ